MTERAGQYLEIQYKGAWVPCIDLGPDDAAVRRLMDDDDAIAVMDAGGVVILIEPFGIKSKFRWSK